MTFRAVSRVARRNRDLAPELDRAEPQRQVATVGSWLEIGVEAARFAGPERRDDAPVVVVDGNVGRGHRHDLKRGGPEGENTRALAFALREGEKPCRQKGYQSMEEVRDFEGLFHRQVAGDAMKCVRREDPKVIPAPGVAEAPSDRVASLHRACDEIDPTKLGWSTTPSEAD